MLAEFLALREIRVFRLFLGVEMVEITEELIEAMHGRQKLVPVPEVILAKLPSGIAVGLEQLGDGRVFLLQPEGSSRNADLGQPGAPRVLPGNEGGPPRGARLLPVVIREGHAL